MPKPSNSTARKTATTSRRTQTVWASFVVAMSGVIGLLILGGNDAPRGGFLAANLSEVGTADPVMLADPVFHIDAELDRDRWQGIVIHHLGAPAGDAETIHRQHLGYGYQGLGYHFVIGNGNGLGNGVVHIGYRWDQQLPGVHTAGPDQAWHNQRSIGICLIGNGDRRTFTERQMRHLAVLVQRLQREMSIPAEAIHLHRDVAPEVTSPGRYFPAAQLESQLLR